MGDFPRETSRPLHVAIGTFTILASGRSPESQMKRVLSGTLAFALRKEGFRVQEAAEVERLLERSELPTARLLRSDELLQLAGKLGPRLLLQGEIHEATTYDLVDEHVQVMINVFVFDMLTGQKVGELRAFGRNLTHYTTSDTLEASSLLARQLSRVVQEGSQR